MALFDIPGGKIPLGNPSRNVLGKKDSLIKGTEKKGNVSDITELQAETNDLLSSIADKIDSLGGESSNGFSNIFSNDDNGGGNGEINLGSIFGGSKDVNLKEFSSKMTDSMESIKASSLASSKSGSAIAKGAGGGGGMVALQVINKVLEAMRGALSMINDAVERGISQNIANQKQYLGPISARLQTYSKDSVTEWKDLSKQVRNAFTNSRYINQQRVLENIAALVKEGIGYNLEDRAYLATIADRTVSTFNLLDANLTRMIRLQQADLTRAQMGSEASLTKFLNRYFQDTSYLNNLYDNVVGQLLDATSQMTYDQTTGFLFNVQKWLSSLYSVGISESAINTIAQGLNYLGSGNVSQLTGNSQLNTLFAMSAQQAGLSYSNLLTYGLSDKTVDKLLESMVTYLRDIADNTDSEILRSEYGRVFGGLSVSDLRAIQNITNGDINRLKETNLTYEEGFKETANQISKVAERTPLAEQIENMFNNLIYSIGAEIGEDEDAYMTWVYSDLGEKFGDYLGGIVPGVIGSIISNGIGVITEGIKTGQVIEAIKDLRMFQGVEWMEHSAELRENQKNTEDALQEAIDKAMATQDPADWQTVAWMSQGGASGLGKAASEFAIDAYEGINAIKTGVQNWEYYSQIGVTDPFIWDNWKQFTARGGQYSSSISLSDNAFAESESKIKSATEEITGVDDSIAKSVDELYDGLFGDQARPIKVVMVDMDGNLIDSANMYRPQNDFEDSIYETYSPQEIFNKRQMVKGIE